MDKLRVLRYKVRSIAGKVLEKSEEVEKPDLHHNDLTGLEDELKPECDILNNLVKKIKSTKESLEKTSEENRSLVESVSKLRVDLNGEFNYG